MKITVTYEVSGAMKIGELVRNGCEVLRGPIGTATHAANAQLDAEGKRLRLKLEEIKVADEQ